MLAPRRWLGTPAVPMRPRRSRRAQALALVRILLGCPQHELTVTHSPWSRAIAGGRRTIRLHRASADGQLAL